MAHYLSQFQPSGSVYGGTFVKETPSRAAHIRQRSSLDRDKWRRAPEFANARIAAVEFGGASRMAAEIYAALAGIKALCRPYTHNHIAKRVRQAAAIQQNKARNQRNRTQNDTPNASKASRKARFKTFTAHHTAEALKGLSFGNDNTKSVHISGSEGRYAIHGLQTANAAMPTITPGECREFRIHIAYVTISDLALNHDEIATGTPTPAYHFAGVPHALSSRYLQPSGWINPEFLTGTEAYCQATDTLQLGQIEFPESPAPDTYDRNAELRIITFVAIEWRQRRGRKTKKLKSSSSVFAHEVLAFDQGRIAPVTTLTISHKLRSRYRRIAHGLNPTSMLGQPIRIPTRKQRIGNALARMQLRE